MFYAKDLRMHFLKTKRTSLRAFNDSDLPVLLEMMTDAEVMRFTGFQTPQTQERIFERLEKWKSEDGVWAVEEMATGHLVAWFMLKKTITADLELGFMIPKKHWNRGFATEVSLALLDFAFTKLGQDRVIGSTAPENFASIRVLRKIGMTEYEEPASGAGVIYFQVIAGSGPIEPLS